MTNESESIIRAQEVKSDEENAEDYVKIEQKATVRVLDAIKNKKENKISYTLILTDELNLTQPIGIELYVEPDGTIECQAIEPEDLNRDYDIKIKIPSQVQ